jgi:hypothetical protein
MRLTYETAIATLIQFIVLSFLNIATGLNSVVTTCHSGNDCVSNLVVSIIFYLLATAWFGCVWILGYAAQERRSKRLAQLLIAAEAFIALIAFFNAKHHTDTLSLITSITDLLLAIWIITLAYRLMKAGGGRVVARGGQRARKRRPPTA